MAISKRLTLGFCFISAMVLTGCGELVIHDAASLLVPHLQRSELIGIIAGFGTTFAAVPDLITMLKRRTSKGMNPRMAAIMGVFQIDCLGLLRPADCVETCRALEHHRGSHQSYQRGRVLPFRKTQTGIVNDFC